MRYVLRYPGKSKAERCGGGHKYVYVLLYCITPEAVDPNATIFLLLNCVSKQAAHSLAEID